MFEDLVPDPGQQGLSRASRIFYVLAAFAGIYTILLLIFAAIGDSASFVWDIALSAVLTLLAFAIGRGIEQQRPWAKWLAYAVGFLELLNFPIGTVIGIAILIYIDRARRAGLFAAEKP